MPRNFFRKGLIAVILANLFSVSVVSQVAADGITWTSRTSAADNAWQSVTYGNGLFVAVSNSGTGNRVMTSENGTSWISRTSAADSDWRSVTYGNNLFVAVGHSGAVMTSPDGIDWTLRTTGVGSNAWNSVTYGNGRFVAVSESGSGNRVMTSEDGISWTARNSKEDNGWVSVTYGNGRFVAVSWSGTSNRVITSLDGIDWTLQPPTPVLNWRAVTYGNNLFVAVGHTSTPRVMSSSNGESWESQANGVLDRGWWSVTYGNNLFVAVATDGLTANSIMTSSNGTSWTARNSPVGNAWRSVTFGNGLFVAVSASGTGNRVMTSGTFLRPPAFTLTSSSESRTVNTVATGFTPNSTGGAIASFSINATPPGMSFDTTTGELTGTPNTVATATTYTVTATNASGTATRTFVLTVTAALAAPAFTLSSSSESRTVNTVATGFTANSTGGAIASFSINATPPGMSFNTTTGELTGTPNTVATETTYTVTATNASGTATRTFALTVTAAVIVTNNPPPPPVQISSISSCQDATGSTTGGNTYSISGSFVTPIFNVQVGNVIIPQSSWVQTPTSVTITMPANTASVVPIIIYNAQVPLLDGCKYTYVTPNSTQATAPKSVQPLASTLKLKVFFGLSSSNITSVEKIKLKSLSAKIVGLGDKITITVTGYAQPTPGSETTDGALSKARAAAVASYLRKAGVDTNVMYAGAGRAAINTASSRYVQVVANNN